MQIFTLELEENRQYPALICGDGCVIDVRIARGLQESEIWIVDLVAPYAPRLETWFNPLKYAEYHVSCKHYSSAGFFSGKIDETLTWIPNAMSNKVVKSYNDTKFRRVLRF